MITLALETSTTRGSVAVVENGALVFVESFTANRTHSSELFACLERALRVVSRCDRIAVGLGPGSYSGVRIAISAAIGLGYGLHGEIVGIPSVLGMEAKPDSFHVIGDARRDSFYHARVSGSECLEGPELLSGGDLKLRLSQSALPVFSSDAISDFPSAQLAWPSAEKIARLAELGLGIKARGDLEPIYLREPHITSPKKT